jgi:DNA polymerase/3'-5' exonuclease PolX
MPRIVDLTRLEPKYVSALKSRGVHSTDSLLRHAATARARGALSRQTGIPVDLIDEWVHMADLMRVNGLGESYCFLLKAAGVRRLEDLRRARADQLYRAIEGVDHYERWVGRLPSFRRVRSWIEASRRIPMVVN